MNKIKLPFNLFFPQWCAFLEAAKLRSDFTKNELRYFFHLPSAELLYPNITNFFLSSMQEYIDDRSNGNVKLDEHALSFARELGKSYGSSDDHKDAIRLKVENKTSEYPINPSGFINAIFKSGMFAPLITLYFEALGKNRENLSDEELQKLSDDLYHLTLKHLIEHGGGCRGILNLITTDLYFSQVLSFVFKSLKNEGAKNLDWYKAHGVDFEVKFKDHSHPSVFVFNERASSLEQFYSQRESKNFLEFGFDDRGNMLEMFCDAFSIWSQKKEKTDVHTLSIVNKALRFFGIHYMTKTNLAPEWGDLLYHLEYDTFRHTLCQHLACEIENEKIPSMDEVLKFISEFQKTIHETQQDSTSRPNCVFINENELIDQVKATGIVKKIRDEYSLVKLHIASVKNEFSYLLGNRASEEVRRRLLFSIDCKNIVKGTPVNIFHQMRSMIGENISVDICEGAYQYKDNTFKPEVSLICYFSENAQKDFIEKIAKKTNQESYLIVELDGSASLHYLDDRPSEKLGTWQHVSKEIALNSFAYSLLNGEYYVASSEDLSKKSKIA